MSIYDTLNKPQQEAVTNTQGPMLILAGAGSGKTRVLTHRIAYLIEEQGVSPWNILAITFTNKAAGEMKERVDKLVGFGSDSIWVSTFHSTCVRILRRYIDRLGYDTNFVIYDTDDQKSLMKDVCKKLQIDTKQIKEKKILNVISSAKNELIDATTFRMQSEADYGQKRMAEAYLEYQAALRKNNALDFDDLLMLTVELFKTDEEVLQYYQNRFQYIMVDEYQDTNLAQFELIRLLAGAHRNLCVVGDDDQSIYKFRGANIRNILDFEKIYPDARVLKLEQNYRSTQNILDAANTVIQNNVGRKDKALWSDRGEGSLIHFKQFDSAYDEADYIARDIRDKVESGKSDYKECAVLYRTNAQSRLLEERFIMLSVPYRVVGGVNFYARKEIKDLLAYLKTINNGSDDLAVKRIINIPKRGIGATTISKVQVYADQMGISFYDALCEAAYIPSLGKSYVKLEPFTTMIQVFRAKAQEYSISQLLKDILETTGYRKELQESGEEDAEDRLANIDELLTKIVTYEESHDTPNLNEFLEEVALVADIDSVDSAEERVLLMTMHSAKGLEFEQVYIAGMEDGIFPSYMTITAEDPMEIEEERRLAYVGITRAKDDLTLTCARSRMLHGETQYYPVSRFVKEIPTNLLDGKLPAKKLSAYEDYDVSDVARRNFNRAAGVQGGYMRKADGTDSSFARKGQSRGETFSRAGGSQNSVFGRYGSEQDAPFMRHGEGAANSPFTRKIDVSKADEQAASTDTFSRGTGGYEPRYGRSVKELDTVFDKEMPTSPAKPKAIVKPKTVIASPKTGVSALKPIETAEQIAYGVGDRVEHVKYGQGTVLAMERGPRDTKVTVMFDQYGQKVMYAGFAKLKKV